ncbi:MAG: two-component regulator propeller domain-containing protein, partial [Saprospiraceae bacterium]
MIITIVKGDCIRAIPLLALIFIWSCKGSQDRPIPGIIGKVYAQPINKPLLASSSIPLIIKDVPKDSIKFSKPVPFQLEKLPSKPFALNEWEPFKKPLSESPIDIDKLYSINVNMDTLKEYPFALDSFPLPQAVIIKVGSPRIFPNTTTGLLQISEEEGLPEVQITATLQTRNADIFFGGTKGLYMYSGEEVYLYKFLNKSPQGNNYPISYLTEDGLGRIWVSTLGDGIYIIDLKKLLIYHHLTEKWPSAIQCDTHDKIWISDFTNQITIINFENKTAKQFTIDGQTNAFENGILSMAMDSNNIIWFGQRKSISFIDAQRKVIKKINYISNPTSDTIRGVAKLIVDHDNNILAGSFLRKLYIISLSDRVIKKLSKENGFSGEAVELIEDSKNQLWIFGRDTSYIIDREKNAIRKIPIDIDLVDQIKGTSLLDNYGNIWLGTFNKGIIIIDTKAPLVEHLTTANGILDNNIWGLLEDQKGSIWMSTYEGINIFQPSTKKVYSLTKKEGLLETRSNRIIEFENQIIINSNPQIYIIDLIKKQLKFFLHDKVMNDINSSCIVQKKEVWFSGYGGILIYNLKEGFFSKIDSLGILSGKIVWNLVTDKSGNVWCGTEAGIATINPVDKSFKIITEKENLCNNIVQDLQENDEGEMWVATQGGLSVISANRDSIKNFGEKEGLRPSVIYDLMYQNGAFYAGSQDGLITISKDTLGNYSLQNFGKRQGFPFNDYNQNVGIPLKNGQSWWGITPELAVITQPIIENKTISDVGITQLRILDVNKSYLYQNSKMNRLEDIHDSLKFQNKEDPTQEINQFKEKWDSISSIYNLPMGLILKHYQNSVGFSYSNKNITGRDKMGYSYFLEGKDTSWSKPSLVNNSRNYYNLTPGKYTFKVISHGANGTWSLPAEYQFSILPPWWQTWWAYLSYLILAGSFLQIYFKYRSKQLVKSNKELENKINVRTAELNKSIESLKSTQAQLIQSEKMASLGELTAGIAHEIQNPLNFVNNFS